MVQKRLGLRACVGAADSSVKDAGANSKGGLSVGGRLLRPRDCETSSVHGDEWVRVADDGDWSTTFRW